MPRRPSAGNISSPYGERIHPITGRPNFHTGEDIGWLAGTVLVAPLDCVITGYRNAGGYGNRMDMVGWWEGHRVEVWLGHLQAARVSVGMEVPEGFHVATMGMTGNADGIHTHWEVRIDGVRVDPADWLTTTAGTDTQPIEEDDTMMKIIAPHSKARGGQPQDNRAVVAPGFGREFPDWDSFSNFCNLWGLDKNQVQLVGDPSFTDAGSLKLFHDLVRFHNS